MPQDCCIVSRAPRLFRLRRIPMIWVLLSVVPCLVPITASQAQERVRTAARQLEIESFRNPETFFRIGPLQEELAVFAGLDFTDNANISHTGKISRVSIREGITLNTTWTLSHINQLQFSFGGALRQDFYGNGKSDVTYTVTPNSLLQFNFAVDDVQVRLYDYFSYTQDPSTNPTVTNTTYLNNLTNTIGAQVKKELNLAVVSLSGDYTYNNQSGSNIQGQTNPSSSGTRNTFRVESSVGFHWSPTLLYGIEDSISRTSGSSQGTGSGNVNSLNVGPFIRGQLSRLTDLDFACGATLLDAKPSVPPTFYLSAILRHQFSRNFQVILAGSHDLFFNTGASLTEEYVLRGGAQFNLTRFITFYATPSLLLGDSKNGSNTNGFVRGNFKEYTIEAGLGWTPHKHLTTALKYDFRRRDAESATSSYSQNTISFDITYTF